MANVKKITTDQRRVQENKPKVRDPEKLKEYRRRWLEKKKALAAGIDPRLAEIQAMDEGKLLERLVSGITDRLTARATELMQAALATGLAQGASIADITAGLNKTAGHDPHSEALLRLLMTLREASGLHAAIAKGEFAEAKKPAPKAVKRRA